MKNLLRLFAIALIGLSIQCKNTPKPPDVVEETVAKQVLFASDIFLLDLDQKEAMLLSQQDTQLTALNQLVTNPKAIRVLAEKLGAFQKDNLSARIDLNKQRRFAREQELNERSAMTSTLKPPKVPPPPPPPCGSGAGCRLIFDPRKGCEILVAIDANQPVILSFMDETGKSVDIPVVKTSAGTGLQILSFDFKSVPNFSTGTLNFNAFDRKASIGFDVAQR